MSNLTKPTDQKTAEIVREGFEGAEIERRNETGSTALAAQAQAAIQARYVVALQRPRNDDMVRVRLLRACERPVFAEKAFYSLPRGDNPGRITGLAGRIEGLSVRFAEEAIRISGNIDQQTQTIYEDDFKRIVRVAAVDLETNAGYSRDVVVDKTVERKKHKDGMVVLGSRTNSAGDKVYIVQTTSEELLQKESGLISRTFRTLSLRLVPPDVVEECEQKIIKTISDRDAKDPDETRKRLCDSFAALGVQPDELAEYIGHALAEPFTKEERLSLGGLWAAIKEGEISWSEALAEKRAARAATTVEGQVSAVPTAQPIAERIKARQQGKAAVKEAPKEEPKKERQPGEEG